MIYLCLVGQPLKVTNPNPTYSNLIGTYSNTNLNPNCCLNQHIYLTHVSFLLSLHPHTLSFPRIPPPPLIPSLIHLPHSLFLFLQATPRTATESLVISLVPPVNDVITSPGHHACPPSPPLVPSTAECNFIPCTEQNHV